MPRQPLGQRVHNWLIEPDGETFRLGKWRFWFIAVAGLQLLNAALTALIFKSAGNLENYMGAILLGVGALVGWIAIGALHYSDASDRMLARGVSALDSVTLLFVIAHFAFLMWAYGHLRTIQSAEAKYDAQVEKYNTDARGIQDANVRIAESAERIAQANERAEKLKNDAAYQNRKAAEAGFRAARPSAKAEVALGTGLQTSQVELERPVKPEKSSATFITEWDAWIRAANFGELLLCALTLIFIRNTTARSNTPTMTPTLPSFTTRTSAPVAPLQTKTHVSLPTSQQRKTLAKTHVSSTFSREGLRLLRESLKDISFRLPGHSFKADVKPQEGCVWIRLMAASRGTQSTVASARATFEILDDATTMQRDAFRERLERFLIQNGFEI